MPTPIAICIEDLDPSSPDERYLRCVALVGRQPGLRLDADGEVSWQDEQGGGACELWVSADDRLIFYRAADHVHVAVSRAGRSIVPPCNKPVVLLDGDELEVGARRLRIHVHGPAPRIVAPSLLPTRLREQAARATAVLAMGAAVVGCDKKSIEVRDHPPSMVEVPADASVATTASAAPDGSATVTASSSIEIRESPPDVVAMPPDAAAAKPLTKPAVPQKPAGKKPGKP